MQHFRTRLLLAVSILVLIFGLACFNFTKPSALQHHTKVAAEKGWPAPSDTVMAAGVLAVIAGASGATFVISRLFARRNRK